MFNIFKKKKKENDNIIDLINYAYKVHDIYNNLVLVDIDIDKCTAIKGDVVKLLNEYYILANTEFYMHKPDYRWRLSLIKQEKINQ
jgi:hypothetical protein